VTRVENKKNFFKFTVPVFEFLKKIYRHSNPNCAMLCHESTAAPSGPSALSLYQDWKHPRTAVGFTGGQNAYEQNTILRCVTNTLIPCTQELFASMGKMRFNVTVLAIAQTGHAKAPNKKGSGGKYMKLVNSKSLFEDIKDQDSISGVRMFSFRKANSNTDRGDRDDDVSVDIHVGEVSLGWSLIVCDGLADMGCVSGAHVLDPRLHVYCQGQSQVARAFLCIPYSCEVHP
jgi:hypothetical protein